MSEKKEIPLWRKFRWRAWISGIPAMSTNAYIVKVRDIHCQWVFEWRVSFVRVNSFGDARHVELETKELPPIHLVPADSLITTLRLAKDKDETMMLLEELCKVYESQKK